MDEINNLSTLTSPDIIDSGPVSAVDDVMEMPVDALRLSKFNEVLQKYKEGKAHLERRVIASEQWWKLRNEDEELKAGVNSGPDFKCKSAWLHNVLVGKHADAMSAYPEPLILPREPGDKAEANKLSSILPLILEQNNFEQVYSDAMWQKVKTGTAVYKVTWDQDKLNGLGDINISNVSLLSVFWEPGLTDIQKSRYFFHCELRDNDLLEEEYPDLIGKLGGQSMMLSKFTYDDHVSTDGKSLVIDVYYKQSYDGQQVMHYCKYVNDHVLYSTENDDPGIGLYEDNLYPFVFSALFPIEGSPCGYGYIDLGKNAQTQLDLEDTALLKSFMQGVTPRYLVSGAAGTINEEELLDITKPLVHVSGSLSEETIRTLEYKPLPNNYLSAYANKVSELRETTGNTETANGVNAAGVTSASGVAALQEAAGKSSKDATKAEYRAFHKIITMCIERMRQFYDMPRQFRITGQYGEEQFVSYDNSNLKAQPIGVLGVDMGYKLPVFDIKIEVAKKNDYTRTSQNELALQFYNLGFFNPQMSTMALSCLDMMDFDGKDELMQKVALNGTMFQQMQQLSQYVVQLLKKYEPANAQAMAESLGMAMAPKSGGTINGEKPTLGETSGNEHPFVERARANADNAASPD